MARSTTETKNIVFNVTGYDPILDLQKKTLKGIRDQKKEAEGMIDLLEKETEAYKKIESQLAKLAVQEKKAQAALEKYQQNFSEATKFVNNYDKAGPKQLQEGIKATERMLKRMTLTTYDKDTKQRTLMDPEEIKKLEAAVKILDVARARQYAMQKGVVDVTKALQDETRGYVELSQAVEVYEKKGRDLARIGAKNAEEEAQAYEKMGAAAAAAKVKMAELDGTVVRQGYARSKEQLESTIKFFREMQKYAGAAPEQKFNYGTEIKAAQQELAQKHKYVLSKPSLYSQGEMEESLKWLREYKSELAGTKDDEQAWAATIREAEEALRMRKVQGDMQYFTNQFANLGTMSQAALNEQVKYWESVAQHAGTVGTTYDDAIEKVRQLNEEIEKRRVDDVTKRGENTLATVTGLSAKNADGVTGLSNQSLVKLDKMKKELEEYKKLLKDTGTDGGRNLQKVNTAISNIEKAQAEVNSRTIEWNKFMDSVGKRKASLSDMEKAYKAIREELTHMNKDDKGWNEKILQMKELRKAIDETNVALGEQESAFSKTMGKLKQYAASFIGFNAIAQQVRRLLPDIVALSDQMTTLEKVSGLTAAETDRVVQSLQGWDVRGTTEELMDLAVQAGKLGVAARGGAEAVTQFVKAGQMVVSTLGEDIGGAQAVSDLLKVNDLVNKSGESIEKSMNRIGSSILVVGNNSTASYAAVTEFVGRLGAVGEAAHLSMSEIIALGGTLDALKQPVEASSTAMGKLLVGMQVNADGLAEKAKVSVEELRGLLAEGKTMEGLFLILKGVQEQGLGIAPVRDLLREIGGRYSQNLLSTFAVLMNNMPMLQQQLYLAEKGFNEATQMEYEFNKANENLAGSVKRLQNTLKELVVNDSSVGWMKRGVDVLKVVVDVVASIDRNFGILRMTLAWFTAAGLVKVWKTISSEVKLLGSKMDWLKIKLLDVKKGFEGLWAATKKFWNANWASILAVIGMGLYNLWEKSREANKALGALSESMRETVTSADAMFTRLKNLNEQLKKTNLSEDEARRLQEERSRLISEINNEYGTYIGFMLSEANAADTIAAAHARVIAKLKEEYALKSQQQVAESVNEKYKDERNEQIGKLQKHLTGILGEKEAGEAMSIISETITNGIANGLARTDIAANIRKEIAKRWKFDKNKKGSENYRNIVTFDKVTGGMMAERKTYYRNEVMDVIDQEQKIHNEIQTQYQYTEGQIKALGESSKNTSIRLRDELLKRYNKLATNTGRSTQETNEMVELAKNILNLAGDDKNGAKLEDKYIARLNDAIKKYGINSVWGTEGMDLTKWSSNKLVSSLQEVNKFAVSINENAQDFAQTYPDWYDHETMKDFSAEDLRNWFRDKGEEMHNELKRRGLTDAGKFKWSEDGSGDWEKKMKEEMELSLKRLEEYYNDRRAIVEGYLAEELISEEEYQRQMSREEQDYLTDRSLLRKQWLGEEVKRMVNGEEVKGYVHDKDVRKIMEGVNFKGITNYLNTAGKDGGKNLVDGIKAAIAKDGWGVQKELSKLTNIRRAAKMDYQPLDKAMDDFRKSIEELNLLYGDNATLEERLEEGSATRRLEIIESFVARVEGMTAGQFATELQKHKEYARMTEEETTLLYERLLQFRADYEEAARKMVVKEMRALTNQVESGEWYAEQLEKYRRYLEERERLLAEAQSKGDDTGRLEDEVAAGRTLVGYMSARQNSVSSDGVSTSYKQQETQRLEQLKESLKYEEQLKGQGVQNDIRIASLKAQVSRQQLKMASEALLIRKAQYGAEVKAYEDFIRAEKEAQATQEMTEEERLMSTELVGAAETKLMVLRQKYAEATKKEMEDMLAAETEFTESEMALFAERQSKIQEFAKGLQEAFANWTIAAANARGESAASIALAEYQESLARAEMASKDLAALSNDELPDALKKTRYAIYNSKGVIEDVYLTPLEKLKKEQEIAVENAKKIAKNEYIDKMSAKLEESINDALKRVSTEQELKDSEARKKKIVEEMQKGSLSIQVANEKEATDAIYAYKIQKEREWQELRMKNSQQSAQTEQQGAGGVFGAVNQGTGSQLFSSTVQSSPAGQDAGGGANQGGPTQQQSGSQIVSSTVVQSSPAVQGAGGGVFGNQQGQANGGGWLPEEMVMAQQIHEQMMQYMQDETDARVAAEATKQAAVQLTGKVEKQVAKDTVKTEQTTSATKENLAKNLAAAMIQSMNLYGIAYNVVSNENMSSTEKMNAFILQTTGQMINTVLSVMLQQTVAQMIQSESAATAKAFGMNPYAAAAIIAVASAAIGVAMAKMKSSTASAQSEIASLTGSSEASTNTSKASAGRLTSGMLTYAKGRDPVYEDGTIGDGGMIGSIGDGSTIGDGGTVDVRGDDGRDYRATYQPTLTTGVYAKPHLGIVGEKGAELIVDHPTYAFLRRNNPEVLRAIYNARVFGRTMLDYDGLNRSATMLGVTSARGKARTAGVRTFAAGNVDDVLGAFPQGTATGSGEAVNEQISGVLQQLTAVLETMQRDGVRTDFHFGGRDGFSKEEKKYNSWAKRHGM